jgi:hypothetical protein
LYPTICDAAGVTPAAAMSRVLSFEGKMSALGKLNQAYATGAVLLAALVGLAFQSWWAFAVGVVALVGLNVVGGNIRLVPARR